jgi:MFS family permease
VRPHSRTIDSIRRGRDARRATSAAFAILAATQVTLIATITVVTVALPAIQRDLRLDGTSMVLVSSAYGLSFGGLLLLGGRLADAWGRRRAFVGGTVVFGIASAVAGLAPGYAVLLGARLAQGVGAALTAPAAIALVGAVFPEPDRRRRVMALWGVLSSAGATAGTVLSGLVITWVSWRWVFVMPAVVAPIAIVGVLRLVPAENSSSQPSQPSQPIESPRRAGEGVDWPGALLATAGLAALVYGVQRSGWILGGAVVLLLLFALVERGSAHPLVPPSFLVKRAMPLISVALCAGAMATAFFLLSLYLQQVRGLSPALTSATFLLPAPAILASGPLAGHLVPRLRIRRVLAIGLGTASAGLLLLSLLNDPYAGLVLFPLGAGLTFSAATVEVMQEVRDGQAGIGGGVLNTAMEVGPPLGLAVLVTLADGHSHDPTIGYAFALRMAAAVLAATALTALLTSGTPSQPFKGESP